MAWWCLPGILAWGALIGGLALNPPGRDAWDIAFVCTQVVAIAAGLCVLVTLPRRAFRARVMVAAFNLSCPLALVLYVALFWNLDGF